VSYFSIDSNDSKHPGRTRLRKMTLAALLAAFAVLLSPLSFPVGPSRCFPFQHAANVMAGVLLGPLWACGAAFTASFVRNILATGTVLAFPGSLFGALAVGFAAKLLPERYRLWAALAEPLATGTLGAWVASLIASPPGGRTAMFVTLSVAFFVSSGPGAAIGGGVLYCTKFFETRRAQGSAN
jgi:energy coupling factor transporter S component ThiW